MKMIFMKLILICKFKDTSLAENLKNFAENLSNSIFSILLNTIDPIVFHKDVVVMSAN